MKSSGLIRPRSGCRQRISASALWIVAGGGIDLRLVVQLELLRASAWCRSLSRPDALARDRIHAGLEALQVVAAALLGAVHRRVGVRDQRSPPSCRRPGRRRCRCSARCAGRRRRSRTGACSASMARCATLLGVLPFGASGFMTSTNSSPPTRATVSMLLTTPLQAPRHFAQQLIARAMAERIVDELEAVEVEHQHGELLRDRDRRARSPARVGRPAARGWAGPSAHRASRGAAAADWPPPSPSVRAVTTCSSDCDLAPHELFVAATCA